MPAHERKGYTRHVQTLTYKTRNTPIALWIWGREIRWWESRGSTEKKKTLKPFLLPDWTSELQISAVVQPLLLHLCTLSTFSSLPHLGIPRFLCLRGQRGCLLSQRHTHTQYAPAHTHVCNTGAPSLMTMKERAKSIRYLSWISC